MKCILIFAALLIVAQSQEIDSQKTVAPKELPPIQRPNIAPQYSARKVTSDGIFAQELSNLGNGVRVPSSRYFFVRHNGETRKIKEGDQFFTPLIPHDPDKDSKKPKTTTFNKKQFDTYNPGSIVIIRPLPKGRTLEEQNRINAIPQSFVTVIDKGDDWVIVTKKGETTSWIIPTKDTKILSIPIGHRFGARMSKQGEENRNGKSLPSYRIEEISKLHIGPEK